MENSINLKGKNVLVTGGSQGIGAAICKTMAACGANILINYYQESDREPADTLAALLQKEYGVKVCIYGADVAAPEAVMALFAFADKEWGAIDVLVNNAGCESVAHAVDLRLEEWDRIFNVNLRGAFICSQEAGKRMIRDGGGVILNITSMHDKVPRKGLAHYCAAKAGLNMLTKCLALELAEHQIRVVAIAPGAIETEMNKGEIERFGRDKFNNWIPLQRLGTVDDITWACAFMASDKAAYCTGTTLYVDGGYLESTVPYDPRPRK